MKIKAADGKEKSLFIEFEISRRKAKTEDVRNCIQQKDAIICKLEQARHRVMNCLTSE